MGRVSAVFSFANFPAFPVNSEIRQIGANLGSLATVSAVLSPEFPKAITGNIFFPKQGKRFAVLLQSAKREFLRAESFCRQ